jgi:crotonobetainyl-CoA:carnitine CoA-transferase CaiB-like acyl-CoA transferase
MRIDVPHASAASGSVPLIANPIRMGRTPPTYRQSPPRLGEHTDAVLTELLGLDETERQALRSAGIVG